MQTTGAIMSEPETIFDAGSWRRRLRIALGEEPADLVLVGGSVVDVFAGDVYHADVAVADGVIAGVGTYPKGRERIDATGQWIAPAFIDAHVHTESALA